MRKTRAAIVGVGNCASSLVQGVEFYKNSPDSAGLMHPDLGGYRAEGIEFSAAFDIDKNKVGKDVSEAVFAKPNCTIKFSDVPKLGVDVMKGMTHDGIGKYLSEVIIKDPSPTVDVAEVLRETRTDVVINYLPVGSEFATKWYVEKALEAGCGFVNCIPVFIAREKRWQEQFEKRKLPIIGDDIKSQVGATIVHRVLANLFRNRGVRLEKTMQLNVGGNSVTGDQEILLAIDGRMKKVKIGDFIDSFIDLYGEKRLDGKDIVIVKETKHNVECFTIDDNYKVVLSDVDALIRHRISEPLYEITTEEGRKIKITGDHNVFVLDDDGNMKEIPVNMLKTKDTYIVVPKILPFADRIETTRVNLTPYLRDLFSQGVYDGYVRIHNHPEIRMPVNFPVNDELLQIVGIWLADGNYDRAGSSNIELACGDEPECMEIVDKFLEEFNINYTVRNDGIGVRLVSKTLGKVFKLALGMSGDAYTKRIPEWVFNLSPRQISLVLKGYVSGDGGVTGKQIRWTSASEDLIRDIQTLFMIVGINSTLFKEKVVESKGSFKSVVDHHWHGLISSKNDIRFFIDNVGFLQQHKNKAIAEAYGKLRRGNTHRIPNIALLKKWKIKSKNPYKISSLRAYIVLSQLDKIKDEFEKEKVRRICASDTRFLKIKSIRKIDSNNMHVYDISTKPFERFICSNILVHNTDFLNMLERERLESKKISKTNAVTSQLDYDIGKENVHIGPSDHVPWLTDRKWAYIRLEGSSFAGVPLNIELKLEVWDSPNSAGVVIDAVRCVKLAMDRGIGGALASPSAYLMKSPPEQHPDDKAMQMMDEFIEGKRDR